MMGLDTTHDCWHGSYHSFSAWRNHVAEAAGYPIGDRDGLDGETYVLPWDLFPMARYDGEGWAQQPVEDPLLHLLVHSDCDGLIHPSEGRHIAARLEQLLPRIQEQSPRYEWLRDRAVPLTEAFIAGLRRAAEAGEDVEFW